MKVLKESARHLSIPLCYVVNQILQQGVFPELLKTAIVKPIHKKGDVGNIENYRPISLLSNISKIIEKLLYIRFILTTSINLKPFLKTNMVLDLDILRAWQYLKLWIV